MEVDKKVLYDRTEQRELPKRFQLCYCFLAFVTRFFTFISLFFPLLLLSLDGFCQPGGEFGGHFLSFSIEPRMSLLSEKQNNNARY